MGSRLPSVTDEPRARATPLIRLGDHGPAVRDVQARLGRLVAPDLAGDGRFGSQTLDAVRDFQRQRGLPADGIVGPETWHSLVEAGFALGDRLLWHSAVLMRGDDVLELQRRLNQLGFDAGVEDGIFGPDTRAAVEELQRNMGLAVDGLAGPATVGLLRRLHRDHQAPGLAARVREREALRQLTHRGLPGVRVLVDPVFGPEDPGPQSPTGRAAHEVTWAIGLRVVARLSAHGVEAFPSRGPHTTPSGSARARLANEIGADLVLSIGVNSHDHPSARGSASYYFGSERFVSESGRQLAEVLQQALPAASWRPDCRTHTMTWAILRETRMTAVVVEPGFLTAPEDAAKLEDAASQDALAGVLAEAVARFVRQEAVP